MILALVALASFAAGYVLAGVLAAGTRQDLEVEVARLAAACAELEDGLR